MVNIPLIKSQLSIETVFQKCFNVLNIYTFKFNMILHVSAHKKGKLINYKKTTKSINTFAYL